MWVDHQISFTERATYDSILSRIGNVSVSFPPLPTPLSHFVSLHHQNDLISSAPVKTVNLPRTWIRRRRHLHRKPQKALKSTWFIDANRLVMGTIRTKCMTTVFERLFSMSFASTIPVTWYLLLAQSFHRRSWSLNGVNEYCPLYSDFGLIQTHHNALTYVLTIDTFRSWAKE